MTDIAALTRTSREGLVETLDGLDDDQWLAPSLCEG